MRDISERQFREALQRHGMVSIGFMGYVGIAPAPNQQRHCVSRWNAGTNRRAQLAYLLSEQAKHDR
jgi:hypothetical protein